MSRRFERQFAHRSAHHEAMGLESGGDGAPGGNYLVHAGKRQKLPGKTNVRLMPGDRIRIETPGGGGWGRR